MGKQAKITKEFKKKIESFISTNNISQSGFAKKCDISHSTISKILSGKQTKISLEKYNNMYKIINSSICDYDSIKDIDIRERGLALRREYNLSLSDMSRIFDTNKENIQLLLKGGEVFPDLHAKVLYYFDNKEEFEELCKEKRFVVSKSDKQKIIDKVIELHNSGIDTIEISNILHTGTKKINDILNNDCDILGYPANPVGRQIFNDIINGNFDLSLDFKDTNLDPYNDIDQEQHNYYVNLDDSNYISEENDDEIFDSDSTFDDDIEDEKINKIDYICNMLRNDSDHFLTSSIDRLIDIISVMNDIDNDKIKIHIDIDL